MVSNIGTRVVSPLVAEERKPLQDHCGIVAAFCDKDIPFFLTGLGGLQILQTRGYDGAGCCAQDGAGTVYQHKGVGMVREVFSPEAIQRLRSVRAKVWVYQVRYGTDGGFHPANVQPFIGVHKRSKDVFIVAHNGQFSKESGAINGLASDTALFTQQLTDVEGDTWDRRILQALDNKRGAWSLIIGTRDALYLARDPYGIRPLVYGHILDGPRESFTWVVTSETSVLEATGAVDLYELLPGTIAKITSSGLRVLSTTHQRNRALCIFENVYIHHGSSRAHLPRSNPRSITDSPRIDDIRRRSGEILGREAPFTTDEVDVVIGVPGTGIEGGIMYARTLTLPYVQAITDRASSMEEQRTFMSANIDGIYQKVLDHFSFDSQALIGKRVVLVDDSIVRGNITKGLIYLLKHRYHVPSVHLRILCPPIDKPCHLGVNTRSQAELIAAKYNGDRESIRKELGAASLAYISSAGLREAIAGDPNARGFCMGCMVGHGYPIDPYGKPVASRKKAKPDSTDPHAYANPPGIP